PGRSRDLRTEPRKTTRPQRLRGPTHRPRAPIRSSLGIASDGSRSPGIPHPDPPEPHTWPAGNTRVPRDLDRQATPSRTRVRTSARTGTRAFGEIGRAHV